MREDTIRLAKEAGIVLCSDPLDQTEKAQLERFAALIREDERERCAKVCYSYAERHAKEDDDSKAQSWMMLQCAAKIRAMKDE